MENKTAGKRYKHELNVDVFDAAEKRFDYIYQKFDDVIISWSGGKDSSTCLELARESAKRFNKLPVKVFFLDEEVIYPETLDLCYRHMADPEIAFDWVCVPSIYRNACSEKEPDFIPFDPKMRELWTHVPPPEAIWPCGFDDNGFPLMSTWRVPPSIAKIAIYKLYAKPGRMVAAVTGLRTEESFVRYTGILSSTGFITKPEHGIYHVRPIYDWKAADIWLAIKERGWDYNRAYDKLWRSGANPITARVAPLFHAEAAMHLRRVMLFWPDFWKLVRRRVRGAHAVAIHNGRLHAVERLNGETWQMAAIRYVEGLSEADKEDMIKYINSLIVKHAKHSPYDVSDDVACFDCGASWKQFARAIARGDRQKRMVTKTRGLR